MSGEVEPSLSLAELRSFCETTEAALRSQDPGGRLAPDLEAALAEPSDRLDAIEGALRRYVRLRAALDGYIRGRAGGAVASPEQREAAALLQRAAPVALVLENGRRVEVVERSWGAIYAMAAHEQAITDATAELRAAEEAQDGETVHRTLASLYLHRLWLLAHATTADGAPARSLDDGAAWIHEVGQTDEVKILAAISEAGPRRSERMGPAPEGEGGPQPLEWFGAAQLFALISGGDPVRTAAAYRRPFFQQLTTHRLANPRYPSPKVTSAQ